jgi:hypothetical protein
MPWARADKGTVEIWIYKIYNEANLSEKAQFMYNK